MNFKRVTGIWKVLSFECLGINGIYSKFCDFSKNQTWPVSADKVRTMSRTQEELGWKGMRGQEDLFSL